MSNYKIQSGDTLSQLARRFGTSVDALAKANGIQNPNLIYAGANLKVPGGSDSFGPPSSTSSSGSAPTSGARGAQPIDASQFGNNAARLAESARRVAANMNTTGWCAKGVGDALDAAGLSSQRVPSAYMKADILARDPRFREIDVSGGNIPPGAVIVHPAGYNGAGSVHGHIAVSLGNGQEASDHIQRLITSPNMRVFVPIG
jgi:murein DD-endopeptidase MepM/ murein hydrolase activator NlpD